MSKIKKIFISISLLLGILSGGFFQNHSITHFNYANAQDSSDKETYSYLLDTIKDYDKAIRLNPKNAYAYFWRGDAKYELERFEEAIKDYDKFIKLKPKHTDAYAHRGGAKLRLKQYKEAEKDFNKAIKNIKFIEYNKSFSDRLIKLDQKSKYSNGYFMRGWAKYRLQQYETSIKDLNKAISLSISISNNDMLYYIRGLAKKAIGQDKEAKKDFDKARKLNSKIDKLMDHFINQF
ncbi:MAG: tetratricopeptide repeat protein [Alphaproteobacteria bacterium]